MKVSQNDLGMRGFVTCSSCVGVGWFVLVVVGDSGGAMVISSD